MPVLSPDEFASRFIGWLHTQLPEAQDIAIEGLNRVEFGYSAEMLVLTVTWRELGRKERRNVVVRLRPPTPGLLEPYDIRRQFDILRALEQTSVRAPRALWIDETGEVLERQFYVMECLEGSVYEQNVPPALSSSPDRIQSMAEQVIDQIAAIHTVDLRTSKLDALGDGRDFLQKEITHWQDEMRRVQRGPLPALEHLVDALWDRRPDATSRVSLVHGDAKCGNFAFVGDEVTGIFDWEMASIGDPMTDIGWAEVTWRLTPPFSLLSAADMEHLLSRYEKLTGIVIHDRSWHRALQTFKMVVILLVGAMHFDEGFNDDLRLGEMARGIPFIAQAGLRELGITEEFESGPVMPRPERLDAVRRAASVG